MTTASLKHQVGKINKQDIDQFIESIIQISENKDLDLISRLYGTESFFVLGSAKDEMASEFRHFYEDLEREFAAYERATIDMTLLHWDSHHDLAWIALKGHLVIHIKGNETQDVGIMRFTFVVQKIEGELYVKQQHVSSPHFGIEEDQVFPSNKGMEEQIDGLIKQFNLNPAIDDIKSDRINRYLNEVLKELGLKS